MRAHPSLSSAAVARLPANTLQLAPGSVRVWGLGRASQSPAVLAPAPVLAERLMARDSFCDMDFAAGDSVPLVGRARAFSASCAQQMQYQL